MTDDVQQAGTEATHLPLDDIERLRSDMREEWEGNHALYTFTNLAMVQDGKNRWEQEQYMSEHPRYWEWGRNLYAEWKMLGDDDFWAALGNAPSPPPGGQA